jgi:hypothetical protein
VAREAGAGGGGARPESPEPIETDWVESGSPRWLTDGEEDDDGEAIVGSADERWPECDIGSVRRRRRRGSSRYSWLGQRSMENSDRR